MRPDPDKRGLATMRERRVDRFADRLQIIPSPSTCCTNQPYAE